MKNNKKIKTIWVIASIVLMVVGFILLLVLGYGYGQALCFDVGIASAMYWLFYVRKINEENFASVIGGATAFTVGVIIAVTVVHFYRPHRDINEATPIQPPVTVNDGQPLANDHDHPAGHVDLPDDDEEEVVPFKDASRGTQGDLVARAVDEPRPTMTPTPHPETEEKGFDPISILLGK